MATVAYGGVIGLGTYYFYNDGIRAGAKMGTEIRAQARQAASEGTRAEIIALLESTGDPKDFEAAQRVKSRTEVRSTVVDNVMQTRTYLSGEPSPDK